ncbi:unnamed protein product, partial [Linum tenue]
MVNVYCSTKGSEKAFALFIYLAEKGHLLKKRSCLKWLSSLEHDIEKCIQLVKKVLEPRANYLNIVCSRVINMLLHAGEMGKALKLLKEVKANGINPDVVTYTMMMHLYCRMDRLKGAVKLLHDMEAK